jgi:hypothetical protein
VVRLNQRWMWSSKEGTEASRSRSFKNRQEWGKKCFEDLDQRRMGRPATRTWSTDFLLLEGSSREERGKWFKNRSAPCRRRRRLLQVVTGTFPCGQQMQKYGYRKTAVCMLCRKAHEECGSSWNGELPKETIGHIQSAGCLGQKEVVTAAHNACILELLQVVNVHGKAVRHMRLLTCETESRLGTLWDQKACNQICSKEEFWEAARDEEIKIPWRAANEGPPVEEQCQERFWRLSSGEDWMELVCTSLSCAGTRSKQAGLPCAPSPSREVFMQLFRGPLPAHRGPSREAAGQSKEASACLGRLCRRGQKETGPDSVVQGQSE